MANTVPGSPLKQSATPTPSPLPATTATTPSLPPISQHATSPHAGSPRLALTPARDPTLTPPPSTTAAPLANAQPPPAPAPSVLAPFASPTALQLASVRRKRKLEQDGYTPSEVAEIQSRAAAFDYAIALDQYDTLYPAQKKFASIEDAVDRLVPWHIWQAPEAELDLPTPERDAADIKRCGEQAEQVLKLKSRFAKARQREGDHPSDLPSLICMLRESTAQVREEINGLQASLRTFKAQHDGILAEERRVREAKEAKERAAREAEAAKERAAREAQAARERAAREAEAAKERQRLMEEEARRRAEMPVPTPTAAQPAPAHPAVVNHAQPVVSASPSAPSGGVGVPNSAPSGGTAAATAGPSVVAPPGAPKVTPQPAFFTSTAQPGVPPTPLPAAPSAAAATGAAPSTTGAVPPTAPPPSAATTSPSGSAAVASPTPAQKTPATPPTRGRPRGRPRGSGRGGAHQTAHPHRTTASGTPATPQAPVQITVAMNQIPAFAQARIIILPNPDNLKAPATIVRTSDDRKHVTLSIDLGACTQLQLQTLARLLNVQAKLPGAKPAGPAPAAAPTATSSSTAPAPASTSAASTSTAPATTPTPAPASTATSAPAQSGTASTTHTTPTAPSQNQS